MGFQMKIIILAGGFGGRFDETRETAKPLIQINGIPIIDRILHQTRQIKEVEDTYVVTNNKFAQQFIRWREGTSGSDQITILNDKIDSWAQRVGSVAAVEFALNEAHIRNDILIIGGDNLFDFDLRKLALFFPSRGIAVPVYNVRDPTAAMKYSVVELGNENRIIGLEEKPQKPKTTMITPCIYGFASEKILLFRLYLDEGGDRDSLGRFMEWLLKRETVYGFPVTGKWVDVGDKESYKLAVGLFSGNLD